MASLPASHPSRRWATAVDPMGAADDGHARSTGRHSMCSCAGLRVRQQSVLSCPNNTPAPLRSSATPMLPLCSFVLGAGRGQSADAGGAEHPGCGRRRDHRALQPPSPPHRPPPGEQKHTLSFSVCRQPWMRLEDSIVACRPLCQEDLGFAEREH